MESNTVYILSSFLGVGLITIFVLLLIKRSTKMEIEKGLIPLFTAKCGGQFGGFSFSPPFVRLALYDDFLVISYAEKIVLRYEKIESMTLSKVLLYTLLEIHHRDTAPPLITLSFFSGAEKVKELIEHQVKEQ